MPPLSYETALALKDAGFPQTWTGEIGSGENVFNDELTEVAYAPTLSELITATRVRQMTRDPIVKWWADQCCGPTLDEALARLYIDRQREVG